MTCKRIPMQQWLYMQHTVQHANWVSLPASPASSYQSGELQTITIEVKVLMQVNKTESAETDFAT